MTFYNKSKVCEQYNTYFKFGCQGYCTNLHLNEHMYIEYCEQTNQDNPPSSEAIEAFEAVVTALQQRTNLKNLYRGNNALVKGAIQTLNNLLVDYPVNYKYHQKIAHCYQQIKSPRASYHYRKCIAIDPRNHIAHLHYANYSTKVSDYKTAAIHYQKSLEIKSNDPLTHGMFAKFLRNAYSDYEASEYHFARSLELNPMDTHVMYQYALLLHQTQRLGQSKHYLEKCITTASKRNEKPFIWAHFEYAMVLKELEEYNVACDELQFCYDLCQTIAEVNYEYGLILCEMDRIVEGLTYLYKAHQAKPHAKTYEETFYYYKNYKFNKNKSDGPYNQSEQEAQTVASDKYSSGSSIPNHLEVTDITQKMQCTYIQPRIKKKRQDPPLYPPQTMMCPTNTPTAASDITQIQPQPSHVMQTVVGTKDTPETKEFIHDMDSDQIRPSCESEFRRWLSNKVVVSQQMSDMYFAGFKRLEYNDIRLLEHFDEETLNNVIQNQMHLRMFQKQISKFKKELNRFEKWFDDIGIHSEYYHTFESKGILTFESFYYYINNPDDIESVIGSRNNADAKYMWKSTPKHERRNDLDVEGNIQQTEGDYN
eukprot:144156_1